MPKKTAKKSRVRKVRTVKDLKASRGGQTKGGVTAQFNPKEVSVDRSIARQ